MPEPPVLISSWRFTGLESLEIYNDYKGGYLYQDLTEDGLTVITNCCMASEHGDKSLEDYIRWTIQGIVSERLSFFAWKN